jgi:hypothetical protein
VLNRLSVQSGGAAVRRRGSSRRRGGEAAGAAERGHAHHPRPGGLPVPGGRAPGRAVAGGGGNVAELPRAAEQAEHLHSGLHTRQESVAPQEIPRPVEIGSGEDACALPCSRRCGRREDTRSRTWR